MLRDLILSAADCPLLPLEVPEWSCTVYLKPWDVGQRLAVQKCTGQPDFAARILVASVCGENGKEEFTEEDVPALMNRNGAAVERIVLACIRQNSIDAEAVDNAKKA